MKPLEIVIAAAVLCITVGVGCELDLHALKGVVSNQGGLYAAALGIVCQFLLMPLVCWLLGYFCEAEGVAILGFVITGVVPGGLNSNIFTMWAKGNIELSAFMSTVSTLLSFALIPLWLFVISSATGIDAKKVNFGALSQTFAIMVVGLLVGIGLARALPSTKKIAAKAVTVVFAVLLFTSIGLVLYEYYEVFTTVTTRTYIAAVLLWPIGAGGSYFLAWIFGFAPSTRRTILMEVSFPNLALGFALLFRIVPDDESFAKLLPFPVLARCSMVIYSVLSVIFFRAIRVRNLENGVVDREEFEKPLVTTIKATRSDGKEDVAASESENKCEEESDYKMAPEIMV